MTNCKVELIASVLFYWYEEGKLLTNHFPCYWSIESNSQSVSSDVFNMQKRLNEITLANEYYQIAKKVSINAMVIIDGVQIKQHAYQVK